jgi:hypothetical protein
MGGGHRAAALRRWEGCSWAARRLPGRPPHRDLRGAPCRPPSVRSSKPCKWKPAIRKLCNLQASSSPARVTLRLRPRRRMSSTAACGAHVSGQLLARGPGQEAQERRGQAWRQHQRQRWGPASVLHRACAASGTAVVSSAAVGVAVSCLFRVCGAGKSLSIAIQRIAACTTEETHWRPSVTAALVRSSFLNTAHSTAPGHSNACPPRSWGGASLSRQPGDPGRHGGGDAARAGLHKPVPVRHGAGGAGG